MSPRSHTKKTFQTLSRLLAARASIMSPQSLLAIVLGLLSLFSWALSGPMCTNQCCRFVEGFPVRLKKLRQSYLQIRDYYEANNDLDSVLLDHSIEDSFNSPFACHVMDTILNFYLSEVLPRAMSQVTDNIDLKPHVESILQIFDELKDDVHKCRNYFSCKKPFDIKDLNSSYTQMESKGLFKAMGELDLLFNYIEKYLASKRQRTRVTSA
ncbi:interleukin-10 [Cynoglossus semilaevis]|uniref:Interleukin family protein n=1 Tax=Cynoglossus semilaevis TaxID=244447 RepID=A0A3P8UYN6_CYNSE|nr:interleukin-10 [Cynoglossus semilaevis]